MKNAIEMLEAFANLSTYQKDIFLYQILETGQISYADFSAFYVSMLKLQNDKHRDIEAELSTCLLLETAYQRKPKRRGKSIKCELDRLIHRTIAILDKVGIFKMDGMKEEYSYDEELGKSQGTFWKE